MTIRSAGLAVLALALALTSRSVVAQGTALGTFRWQVQPFCNVVTLTITQVGALYRLEGTDDQCGAAKVGSVVGMAFPNPDGSVGFGFTTVVPGSGAGLHTDAAIALTTLGGSWRDSAGNSGAFALTLGASTGGAPRPASPPSSGGGSGGPITAAQIPDGLISTTKLADGAVTGAKIADGAITGADVANGAIDTAQIAGSAVTSSRIADGGITTFDIANGAITAQKLAANAVTRALDCVTVTAVDAVPLFTVGPYTATAPVCSAGYTSVSTSCWSNVTFLGTTPEGCVVGGVANAPIFLGRRCCRVP